MGHIGSMLFESIIEGIHRMPFTIDDVMTSAITVFLFFLIQVSVSRMLCLIINWTCNWTLKAGPTIRALGFNGHHSMTEFIINTYYFLKSFSFPTFLIGTLRQSSIWYFTTLLHLIHKLNLFCIGLDAFFINLRRQRCVKTNWELSTSPRSLKSQVMKL